MTFFFTSGLRTGKGAAGELVLPDCLTWAEGCSNSCLLCHYCLKTLFLLPLFALSYMVWPQNFVVNNFNAVPCLGTGEDEIWMTRKEKQSTQESKHRWSEHTVNGCLSWAHFSQILHKVLHPTPKWPLALIIWQNCQEFAALLCCYSGRQQEEAKCFSGPIESLKCFPSFWTWDITEILGDFMNGVFIELGERRKENGVQPMTQPWPCLFCGLGRRWSTDKLEASFHCQRAVGKKSTGKWGCWATSSMVSVSFVELRQGYYIFSRLQL